MSSVSIQGPAAQAGHAAQVLEDLDLEVHEPASSSCCSGPSGCGKSTLLHWHRRPARRRRRPDLDRRAGRHLGRAEGPRHRHGVPVVRALPADERREEPVVRAAHRRRAQARDRRRVERAADMLHLSRLLDAQAGAAVGRPAPARARSAARWCATSTCSCSTSRCPTSTPSCARELRLETEAACTSGSATTMIYVTHDQVEALTLADRVAVMHRRRHPAARDAAGDLPRAGQPVRGGLPRLAAA